MFARANPRLRSLGDERGFTIPELTVAVVIGLMVIATAMMIASVSARTQPKTTGRAGDLQLGRSLMERLTRELRQGQVVYAATPSGLEVLTHVDSASCAGESGTTSSFCRVSYFCTSTACSRTVANPDGTGESAPVEVLSGIEGPNVFSYSPSAADPNYVSITLVYAGEDGGGEVTLSDGASLRNHLATGTDP